MTENDDKVKVICGLTMCPADYPVDTEQIITAFFEKRRSEVPATVCMPVDEATDAILTRVTSYADIQQCSDKNLDAKLMPMQLS